MLKLKLQFFGGRGSTSGSGSGRMGGSGGVSAGDIIDQANLISEREGKTAQVDEVLGVMRDVYDEYGLQTDNTYVAELKPSQAGVLGFSDGSSVSINKTYFNNPAKMEAAYDKSIADGYHPGKGNKTALEAVMAHELGHNLTQKAAGKMGTNIDGAATQIVTSARKATGDKGVVIMARKISGYATVSNAEAVAEAFSDVYCNGNKATKQSRAIVNELNKYVK